MQEYRELSEHTSKEAGKCHRTCNPSVKTEIIVQSKSIHHKICISGHDIRKLMSSSGNITSNK